MGRNITVVHNINQYLYSRYQWNIGTTYPSGIICSILINYTGFCEMLRNQFIKKIYELKITKKYSDCRCHIICGTILWYNWKILVQYKWYHWNTICTTCAYNTKLIQFTCYHWSTVSWFGGGTEKSRGTSKSKPISFRISPYSRKTNNSINNQTDIVIINW